MKKHTYICYQENKSARPIYLDQIFAGIKKTAAARRETVVSVTSTEEAISVCADSGEQCVIMLLSDRAECGRVFHALSAHGIHVIMANMGISSSSGSYSLVEADYEGTAYRLTAKLLASGVRNPVFLGFNPKSYHDALRLRGVHLACAESDIDCPVIENREDVAAAAEAFFARRSEFDAVICSNDFITYCLLRSEPAITQLPIVSLGGQMAFADTAISAVLINYEQLGARIVDAYLLLAKCDFLISVTLRIPPQTENIPGSRRLFSESSTDNFYQDQNVDLVERIQRIRSGADAIDTAILEHLRRGMTYERIAEELFLSVRTVKSHAKKLFDAAGCRTKKEFLSLLNQIV